VRVSRWRCRNPRCATTIFGERLPGVAAPHAQQTYRLGVVVHLVGHALGGRAGERLLDRLGMPIGADTIVRVVKRGAPPPNVDKTLRVVGIDTGPGRRASSISARSSWTWSDGASWMCSRCAPAMPWPPGSRFIPAFGSSAEIATGRTPAASAAAHRKRGRSRIGFIS